MPEHRRFYFDDGNSRKRWHIEVRGKSQFVRFGRLGGSLRESKKTYGSPAERARETDKLIAKKRREGYIEIDPARLEFTRPPGRRKATEKQVETLEKRIGQRLPDEYRTFLITTNGGLPNPDFVAVPGFKNIESVGVGTLFHLQPAKPLPNELGYQWTAATSLVPPGHLPIAGSSDLFTLSLVPKTLGCVFWWSHDTDEVDDDGNFLESAGYLFAGSFDEFLTRIAVFHGDDDDSEYQVQSDAPELSARRAGGKATPRSTVKGPTLKGLLRLVSHQWTASKVKEIQRTIDELGDLSGIQDGQWPFINIDNSRVINRLLKAGLNPEITDAEGHSLLWQCARDRECIDLLVGAGAKVDRRSGSNHETGLMRAIYVESLPAVTRFLQLGANPTVRLSWPIDSKLKSNSQLRKTIEKARQNWRKKQKKASSKKSVAKSVKSRRGDAPASGRKPKPTLARLLRLMRHDFITDQCDEVQEIETLIDDLGDLSGIQDGKWPKIDKLQSPRLLAALLTAGLDPEITDRSGISLLCQCVSDPDCIDLLVRHGVDVDRRSGKRQATALMVATWKGDQECVERLLRAGADPTLEFDAFSKVMLGMDEDMTALIESARRRWNRKPGKPKTATTKRARTKKK